MISNEFFSHDLTALIKDCHVGDHFCSFYETEKERNLLVSYFILVGLEKGEQVVFMDSSEDHSSIYLALDKLSIDVESVIDTGQLTIEDGNQYYLPEGKFKASEVMLQLQNLNTMAEIQQWKGLRYVADVPFAIGGPPGENGVDSESLITRFIRYESEVNTLFPNSSTMALCLYKRSVFPDKALANILCAHPRFIHKKKVCENQQYIPTTDWSQAYPIKTSLDDTIRQIVKINF